MISENEAITNDWNGKKQEGITLKQAINAKLIDQFPINRTNVFIFDFDGILSFCCSPIFLSSLLIWILFWDKRKEIIDENIAPNISRIEFLSKILSWIIKPNRKAILERPSSFFRTSIFSFTYFF